ncbi:hypothetical protein C8J57DRAFT_1674844 [Mycena rebaudengoi]|nr:hypothetical protein C8J57DRAFT_1674844 [Mycena rebaudengoi]
MSKSETHPFRPAPPRYRAALLKSADPTVAATRGTASRAKTPQKGAIRRIADTLVESQRCSFFCPDVAALNGGTAAVALAFPDTQFFKGIPYLKEISYPSHPMCAPAVYAQIQRPSGTQAGVTNPAVLQAANTPQPGPVDLTAVLEGVFSPSASSIRIHRASSRLDLGCQIEFDHDRRGCTFSIGFVVTAVPIRQVSPVFGRPGHRSGRAVTALWWCALGSRSPGCHAPATLSHRSIGWSGHRSNLLRTLKIVGVSNHGIFREILFLYNTEAMSPLSKQSNDLREISMAQSAAVKELKGQVSVN